NAAAEGLTSRAIWTSFGKPEATNSSRKPIIRTARPWRRTRILWQFKSRDSRIRGRIRALVPAEAAVAVACLFYLIGSSLIAWRYVLPVLAKWPIREALVPLILMHLFRPLSMLLIAPGLIVSPSLPRTFALNTAYGDLFTATLALATIVALSAD